MTPLLFLFSVLASPAPIELAMEVELKPGEVLRPSLTVNGGDWSSVTSGDLELRVRAKSNPGDTVHVEAEIRENIKGVPVLRGIPSVLTPYGMPAEVKSEAKNKTLNYRFKVTPRKG